MFILNILSVSYCNIRIHWAKWHALQVDHNLKILDTFSHRKLKTIPLFALDSKRESQ